MGRVFEWLLPQPVDDCLRVLSSCLLGGKSVTPLMCSTSETIGSNSADDGEDTVSCHPSIILTFSLLGITEGPHMQPWYWMCLKYVQSDSSVFSPRSQGKQRVR